MHPAKIALPLVLVGLLSACSTTLTPAQKEAAEKNKGTTVRLSVHLEASDRYSTWCGHVRPNESIHCSKNILISKLEKKAQDFCGVYRRGEITWSIQQGLYPRASRGEAVVTCLGLDK